jgi:hypothetical protein
VNNVITKHRRLRLAVALIGLAVAVYAASGPWARIRRTALTHDQYTARYDGVALPPTASDISLYVHKAWGDEEIVISFTVPDEKTFVDWATANYEEPQPGRAFTTQVKTFDGGQLHTEEIAECSSAYRGCRADKYLASVTYDKKTRRVYVHTATHDHMEN